MTLAYLASRACDRHGLSLNCSQLLFLFRFLSFDVNCDVSCERAIILDQEMLKINMEDTVRILRSLERKGKFLSPLSVFRLWLTVFQNISVYS